MDVRSVKLGIALMVIGIVQVSCGFQGAIVPPLPPMSVPAPSPIYPIFFAATVIPAITLMCSESEPAKKKKGPLFRCKSLVIPRSSSDSCEEPESPCPRSWPVDIDEKRAAAILQNGPKEVVDWCSWRFNRERDEGLLPKKMLFFGPPGSGKKTLAKAFAKSRGMETLFYRSCALTGRYYNTGSQNLIKIFRNAHQLKKPCAIIIDELHKLVEKSEDGDDPDCHMLLSLLSLLEKYEWKKSKIFFIGTTDFFKRNAIAEKMIDRFGAGIKHVPLPNEQQRERALEMFMGERAVEGQKTFEAGMAKVLAKRTEGYSYRKLQSIVNGAFRIAVARNDKVVAVTLDDCMETQAYKDGFWLRVGYCIKSAAPCVAAVAAVSAGVWTYLKYIKPRWV